ncbi:hypothetical protein E2562_037273 [Oryza meyeriana var. granulata]|uniref:Uncharacterized protein n=1 Tax=Oryza meyeriana var. granulata TaxID=110450 RepID=A0A6G1ECM6_9ORYZ|nr:hypothetical protein E2562_037273 [Oryza meyeriana var. granulata]
MRQTLIVCKGTKEGVTAVMQWVIGPYHHWRGDAGVVVRPVPTTEDDTTVAAEVSSTAFTDVDKEAGRPTPLTGATEDHPPMEEDPTSTVEGDTIAPAEVSPTVFADVDEVARQPTPLTGVTKDRAPTVKDPATTAEKAPTSITIATTEGDTTAAAEVSSTIIAELDDPIAAIDLAAMTIDDD